MKINQVEELVGISKKNIRFYESQGLIDPNRNPENGYREYSLQDVNQLNKIKLLRKLDVPIEKIRQIQEKELSMEQVMEDHVISLSHRQRNLEHCKEICNLLATQEKDFDLLKPEQYLEDMQQLEEGGTLFVSIEKKDVKKEKTTISIIAAIGIIIMLGNVGLLFFAAGSEKDFPYWFLVIVSGFFLAIAVGILVVLRQRMKEIDGGELDEASKY